MGSSFVYLVSIYCSWDVLSMSESPPKQEFKMIKMFSKSGLLLQIVLHIPRMEQGGRVSMGIHTGISMTGGTQNSSI